MRSNHAVLGLVLLAVHGGCSKQGATPPAQSANAAPASSQEAAAAPSTVVTEELSYKAGDTELKGFLARPAASGPKRPGILIVHEWWGLNDYVRSRARMLADLGYVALAVDMYGGGKNTEHPEEAKKYAMEVGSNREEGARRFAAARSALVARPEVDDTKLAAIGYCFGGAVVLGAARAGADFDLVATFHGNYATDKPMAKDAFPGALFIAHGAADSFVPAPQVDALKRELDQAGARYEFVAYPGAKHGFTNPDATRVGQSAGIDIAYNAEADAQSWSKLQELLTQSFASP